MEGDGESYRTVAALIVKVLTVHIVTTANYAYLCSLQHRSMRGWQGVARITFFFFTPTVAYMELAASTLQSIVNFIRDEGEDEITNFWFFLSAALGMHAYQRKPDDGEIISHKTRKMKLLQLTCAKCDRARRSIDWTWCGKTLICLFTLTQGVGTIVNWILRIVMFESFGMDDRSGMMGCATALLSTQALLILLMRYDWTINQPVSPQTQVAGSPDRRLESFTQLAIVSLVIQDFTYTRNWRYDHSLPNPSSIILELIRYDRGDLPLWPFVFLGAFCIMLRNELAEKLRLEVLYRIGRKYLGPRTGRKVRVLLHACIMLLVACDILIKLGHDIAEIIMTDRNSYNAGFWKQTPLSEIIPVL